MPIPGNSAIRAAVFDLDGTLYISPDFADSIQKEAAVYIAGIRGVGTDEACRLITDTRTRLNEDSGTVQTLSNVCIELGGNIPALHDFFKERLRPEDYLMQDERVVNLLDRLKERLDLYIYTNNNRSMTTRIIRHLGLEARFIQIFAIDDAWSVKPDEIMLEQILTATGLKPAEVLFIGDRYDIDLRLPEQKGCPVFLSQSIEQLLRLETLIT